MKLNKKKVAQMKADISEGKLSQPELAKKYKCSRSLVSDITTDRAHTDVPWPDGEAPRNKPGGQRKPVAVDAEEALQEALADIAHLTEERNQARRSAKVAVKEHGLFKAVVQEMDHRVKPFTKLPPARVQKREKGAIKEHLVMHVSDMHADQIVTPEECGGLEEYNFPIACARAEKYVDTVLDFTQDTLAPKFDFTDLWFLSYGDQTSGEIHGHGQRSYYRNMFRNCLAIGQLQALMLRDLAPYFQNVHVVCLPGNHGRRSLKKDYNAPHDNWDTLIAEVARLHCRDLDNIGFLIPESFSINLDINGSGFNISHGDDVKSNGGIPWYGFVRRQKSLMALNQQLHNSIPLRYFVCGHHHALSSLSDGIGELIVNGAWPGTDSYSYNSFAGYREPCQLMHGVHAKHGITWKLGVKLKQDVEVPRRYKIDGAREIAVPK